MVKKSHILNFKTVCECNRYLKSKTWHPQVSLIHPDNSLLEETSMKFEFYAILLMRTDPSKFTGLGRTDYNYSHAAMLFLAPGEVFCLSQTETLSSQSYLLVFHPELLERTSLQHHLNRYTFFGYRKEEALHLSARETEKIMCCMENIDDELHHPIDTHTATLLSRHIELLLDYCTRYYERQFIIREDKHGKLLEKAKKTIDNCILTGQLSKGLPLSADFIAEALGISTAYFTDLLRFETGHTPEVFFQLQRMQAARRMLLCPEYTTAEISHWLGYPSVQYFSLLFKRLTGIAPCEYCHTKN